MLAAGHDSLNFYRKGIELMRAELAGAARAIVSVSVSVSVLVSVSVPVCLRTFANGRRRAPFYDELCTESGNS